MDVENFGLFELGLKLALGHAAITSILYGISETSIKKELLNLQAKISGNGQSIQLGKFLNMNKSSNKANPLGLFISLRFIRCRCNAALGTIE